MRRYDGSDPAQRTAGLTDAIASAKRGDLVLANADGAYVLLTDAFSARGVRLLREFKQRPDMNVPVLVGRPETFDGIAMTSGAGALLLIVRTNLETGAATTITLSHTNNLSIIEFFTCCYPDVGKSTF